MRFQEVRIRNFLSVGEEQILHLDRAGLVCVTGVNKDSRAADSNGAGKSTILEALVWCLWGNTIRNLKSDEVVNRRKKKDCRVSVTFEDETVDPPISFEVIRTRKDKSSKKAADLQLLVNGVSATAGTNADTQELVDTVVGMEQRTFMQAVLLTAGGRSFCGMTDGEQKAVLDDILQLSSLQQARAVAKQHVSSVEAQLAAVVSSSLANAAERRVVVQQLESALHEEAEFVRKQGLRVIEYMKLKTEEVMRADEYADSYNLAEAAEALATEKARFLETHTKDDDLSAQRNEILSKVSDDRVAYEKKLSLLESKKVELTRRIGDINGLAGADCPTCSQNVHPDTADAFLAQWEGQIHKIDALYKKITKKLDSVLSAARKKSSTIEKKRATFREDLERTQAVLAVAIERVKKAEHATAQVFASTNTLSVFDSTIAALKEEANIHTDRVVAARESLADVDALARKYAYRKKSLELHLRHLRFWVAGFGNQGMKSYMLDSVIPFLTERAQKYADILSGGDLTISFSTQTKLKGGKVKEQFQVKVINGQGADVYRGNSAGEQRRGDVAVGWALGDLAATRARKPIRFKGLDEPFESLDGTGEDAVIRLLHAVLPEYETILCITHSSHLKSQFPKELSVVKEGGYSRIES